MIGLPDFSKMGELVPKIEGFIAAIMKTMENLFEGQNRINERLERIENEVTRLREITIPERKTK